MEFTASLTPAEEGGYIVLNPETGTTTQGKTVEEAVANLREATALYLEEFPMVPRGSAVRTARAQIAGARRGKSPNFHLNFESARSLFADLTPARVDLLDTLRKVGPCSVYALAKSADRNYSNVHTDVGRIEQLGLIERDEQDAVFVPFESVEILLPLAQVA